MPINKFKYRERQILCIRLKWNKVLYAWEWPLCHDLLRFSLCSDDLLPSLKIDWVRGSLLLNEGLSDRMRGAAGRFGQGFSISFIFGSGALFWVRGTSTVLAKFHRMGRVSSAFRHRSLSVFLPPLHHTSFFSFSLFFFLHFTSFFMKLPPSLFIPLTSPSVLKVRGSLGQGLTNRLRENFNKKITKKVIKSWTGIEPVS